MGGKNSGRRPNFVNKLSPKALPLGTNQTEPLILPNYSGVKKFADERGLFQGAQTLQEAYENSTTPEITTDSTRGALTLKRGSAADSNNMFEILRGDGTSAFSLTAAGYMEMLTSSNITFTIAENSSNIEFETDDGDLKFIPANGTVIVSGDVTVTDEAYGAGWNGSLEVPTKNAVYDKIETIAAPDLGNWTFTDSELSHDATVAADAVIVNDDQDKDILIKVNDGGVETTAIQVHGDKGVISMPAQCYVKATRSTDLTISHNTSTTVTAYDSETDDGGNFNTTTGVFTAPEAGKYLVISEVRWLNLTANKRYYTTCGGARSEFYMPTTTSFSTIRSSAVLEMGASGTASVVVTQLTGVSRDVTNVIFWIIKIA